MFTIQPLTEQQIDALTLMADGTYNFEVVHSESKTSKKNGNPMAELKLTVWDNEGMQHNIKDFLIFSNVAFCIRKVKHFCDATGIGGEYLSGSIRENFTGLSGKVVIGTQDETEKEGGGFYPKKNIVVDYVVMPKDSASMPLQSANIIVDDDVPF